MKKDLSDDRDLTSEPGPLETADSVARAAHMWIRSICLNETQREDERLALAGGLIAGLCERLELNPRIRELVGYVYVLLNDQGGQALAVSRMMLDQPAPARLREAFTRGRFEAAAIVEMLAYCDRAEVYINDGDDSEWSL